MDNIGIERIGVYPSSLALDLSALAHARGQDLIYLRDTLMVTRRSVAPLWEDPVTLAVNSSTALLNQTDRREIGLLIVATESGLDQEKTISTWVHRHLDLPSTCRMFELKAACHAGAAALRMAEAWISSGRNDRKKALLINVDVSNNMIRNGNMEYSLGLGAVALLVSNRPDYAVLEKASGIHSHEVTDVIRPLPWREIAFDVQASLFSYLDGLEHAFSEYSAQTAQAREPSYFDYHVYHMPFPGMSKEAHRLLMQEQGRFNKEMFAISFEEQVRPSLHYSQQLGATYCGSIFLGLFSLIRMAPGVCPGHRVGVYSYGSGACAEYFSVQIGEHALDLTRQAADVLDALLARRQLIDVPTYEKLECARSRQLQGHSYRLCEDEFYDWYATCYSGSGYLVLDSIDNHLRSYRRA